MDGQNQQVSIFATGLPGRYSTALFDLAEGAQKTERVAGDLRTLAEALEQSSDFSRLITAPQVSRADDVRATREIGTLLGLDDLTIRFLGVLAENRRLALLPQIVDQFESMLSAWQGSTTAQVTSAQALTDTQADALRQGLERRTGKKIKVRNSVDPAILGGLVIHIGSQQIDSSIRTRLERLGQQMKGQQ